ncbi:MAG TPA: zinc ribbon domain-containing protein [Pirellulales bacterium]|nr:zinc ribbon domain-containing protein [Pirellulales bacterium]
MPTYDYVCDACGHKFELFQSINDPVKRKCPECSKRKLRRLIGAGAAIMFKGSGFYQTDYRSDKYKERAAADKPPSESSGDKSSGDKSSGDKSSGDKSSGEKSAARADGAASARSESKSSAGKSSSRSGKKK